MANSIADLNNALYAQLDRLSSMDTNSEDLEAEIKRSDAITSVASEITRGSDLQLKAAKLFAEHGSQVLEHLPLIGGPKSEG